MLESQEYAFSLVRNAMERAAAIVIVRGARHWIGAVPELHRYGNRIEIVTRRVHRSRAATSKRMDSNTCLQRSIGSGRGMAIQRSR